MAFVEAFGAKWLSANGKFDSPRDGWIWCTIPFELGRRIEI